MNSWKLDLALSFAAHCSRGTKHWGRRRLKSNPKWKFGQWKAIRHVMWFPAWSRESGFLAVRAGEQIFQIRMLDIGQWVKNGGVQFKTDRFVPFCSGGNSCLSRLQSSIFGSCNWCWMEKKDFSPPVLFYMCTINSNDLIIGASSGTVELLPPPSSTANWTVGLPTDNGHDSDQVFEFNGTQAVKVPDNIVTINLKEPFVVSVWMRHGPGSREKETILCNSDKTGWMFAFLPLCMCSSAIGCAVMDCSQILQVRWCKSGIMHVCWKVPIHHFFPPRN